MDTDWPTDAAPDARIASMRKRAETDLDIDLLERLAAVTQERDDARRALWVCGCGWTNGSNLATCAQCGRTPIEWQALPYESDAYRAHQRADKATTALLALRAATQIAIEQMETATRCSNVVLAWQVNSWRERLVAGVADQDGPRHE